MFILKKRYLIALLVLPFILASCGGEKASQSGGSLDNTNQVEPTNGGEAPDKPLVEPSYTDPDFSVIPNEKPSNKTDIENTVDLVYDTVVSIDAYSNTTLSRGSGVLFAHDDNLNLSFIVTCFHVIDGAERFYVNLTDSNSYEASVVGAYKDLDLAVLSIEKTGLSYASFFDDSDKLKLGSTVVCIGNPLGTLPGSVSAGIVSYVNREIPVSTTETMTLIQTDVAINSGNSGGGLFNTSGALIGIVNAKYSSEGIEGLGFAIPINDVRKTVTDILNTARYDVNNKRWECGYVENDYELGFSIKDGYYTVGSFIAPQYVEVVYITDFKSGSVYSTSSELRDQDILKAVEIKYNKSNRKSIKLTDIAKADQVIGFIKNSKPMVGDTIKLTILRDDKEKTISFDIVQYRYTN